MTIEPRPLPGRDPGAEARGAARRTAERLSGWGAVLASIGVVLFLMTALVVLDYKFDQDPHRIFKVVLGLFALGGLVVIPRIGLIILPIVTPFLHWVPPLPIPGLNALNLIVFGVFGSYSWRQLMARKPVLRPGKLGWTIVMFLGLCAVSILRGAVAPTGYGYDAAQMALVLFRSSVTFLPYFIVLAMIRDHKARQQVQWAVLVGLLCESLATAKFGRNGAGGRAVGSIGQSNELGAYLALFSVLASAVMIGARSWFARIAAALVFTAGCYGIMLSLSRGSMLALLGGVVVVTWRSARWMVVVLALALATSPLWVPDYVKDRITSSKVETEGADQAQVDAASEIRLMTWRAILDVVSHHPIDGVGFGGLGYVLPDVGEALGLGDVKDTAHNTYLRSLSEMGVLGLVLFLTILWKAWSLGDEGVRRLRRRGDRVLAIGLCGGVVAMAISCMFGDRFWCPDVVSSFWILCALVNSAVLDTGPETAA